MARYASGKKAWGFSDRSGFRYRLSEMMTEWNGMKVGPDEYEPKHPQLIQTHTGSDPQALFEPRTRNDKIPETVVFPIFDLNRCGGHRCIRRLCGNNNSNIYCDRC